MKRGGLRRIAGHVDSLALWAALGMLGIVLVIGARSAIGLVENTGWVDHTHRVIEALDDATTRISQAVNARRGFSLTGDQGQLDRYAEAVRGLTGAERRVRALTSDNHYQQRRLDDLEPLLARRIAHWDAALEYRRTHGFTPERETMEIREGTVAHEEILARVATMAAEEQSLLELRERRMAASLARTRMSEVAGAGMSLALLLAVVVRLRREVRRRLHSEQAIRRSEQALKRLNEELERRVEARTAQLTMANAELESFSYSVVHNLRAPLRGMGSFAELLLAEGGQALSAEARDYLREIHRNAADMAALIDGLVAMSRITRREPKRADVDLSALVRAVAGSLAAAGSRPLPALVVEERVRAQADPALARALIEILLGNSWKFTGDLAAARIEFGGSDIDGERVLFVRDNGAGFDMDYASKLFTPFGRLHTVKEFPGIGVGLATARRIVQLHGGRIWAEGRAGAGATFYFTLCPKPG